MLFKRRLNIYPPNKGAYSLLQMTVNIYLTRYEYTITVTPHAYQGVWKHPQIECTTAVFANKQIRSIHVYWCMSPVGHLITFNNVSHQCKINNYVYYVYCVNTLNTNAYGDAMHLILKFVGSLIGQSAIVSCPDPSRNATAGRRDVIL